MFCREQVRERQDCGLDLSPERQAKRVFIRFESGPMYCILALRRGSVRVLDDDIRATFLPERFGTATAPYGGGAGRPEVPKELV